MKACTFTEIFSGLKDPRKDKGKKYPFIDVIVLSIFGVMCGKHYFTHISEFLQEMDKATNYAITKAFHLERGVPSHDVFSDVFRDLNKVAFTDCLVIWTSIILPFMSGDHVAIDGKAIRAARERAKNGDIPYIISAFLCDCNLSLGQMEIGEKKNEISEIPRFLDMLDIAGKMITIDAIGNQVAIHNKIIEKGADFCIQLKNNQPNTFQDVEALFEHAQEENKKLKKLGQSLDGFDYYREVDKGHGRIEVRQYYTYSDTAQIRLAIDPKWEHVKAVGMAILKRTVLGETPTESVEIHYSLISKGLSAKEYARYTRGHWAIENSLHWVLDESLGEDRSTSHTGNSISNISAMRKFVYNMISIVPKGIGKTSSSRKTYYQFHPEEFFRILNNPAVRFCTP